MRIFLFVMLALLLQKNCFCQQPFCYRYSMEEGMLSNNVFYAFQDSKGYMWFGTNAGVSTFDGYDFKNYTTEHGLADNEIFQINEDSKHRLWFSTMNGRLCYYDSVFHSEENETSLKNTSLNYPILSFLETKDGSILFGSSKGGIIRLNRQNTILNQSLNPSYHYIWEKGKRIYALSPQGIIAVNNDFTGKEQVLKKMLIPYINRAVKIGSVIYFGQKDSIYIVENNTIKNIYTIPSGEEIISLSCIGDSTLWAGTRNGVFVIAMNKKNSIKKYFHGYSISSVLEDREGNIWVTSLDNGIYFIPSSHVFEYADKEKQPDIVHSIYKSRNKELWLSKSKSIYTIYSGNKAAENFKLEDNRELAVNNIRNFGELGTWVTGKESIKQILGNSEQFFPYWANDVLLDHERNLWLATSTIIRIPYEQWTKVMTTFDHLKKSELKGPEKIISGNAVVWALGNILCKDAYNNIWIGTDNGLYKYAKGSVENISKKYKDLEGRISDIKFDEKTGEVFVATQKAGIAVIKNEKVEFIGKKQGLPINMTFSVVKDIHNFIWVASSKGLNKITSENNSYIIENYSSVLGLPIQKINYIQADGDTIYLATNEGLIVFNSQYVPKKIAPLIRINSFMLRNKVIDHNKLQQFNYNDNALSFTYTGLSYRDRGQLIYSYMLEGYDTAWQKTNLREIQYNALPAGEYVLKIVAINGLGIKSAAPATVSFTILPPFWEKWWFRLISILVISGIIYFFWKRRIKVLQKRFELKQKAIELENDKIKIERDLMAVEQKALRLQMNPHFIFNALNTIKGYYAENNVQQAGEYIGKFSKLLRFILENTKSLISLQAEIEILRLYIELAQIRYKNKFDFTITASSDINQSETVIPPMLLQPFVENSIIHGLAPKEEKGLLSVQFNTANGYLVCTVIDNGIGLAASREKNKNKEHTSMATQITQERLDLYETEVGKKCSMQLTELESDRTKVEIKLPIKNIWT